MFTVSPDRELSPELVLEAIKYNEEDKERYDMLDDYYLGKHKIFSRTRAETKANNRVMVNHAKYITDINTGYLIGQPVEYQPTGDIDLDFITEEYDEQLISDHDFEYSKSASIFGRAYEYSFVDEEKNVITKVIDPRNCIVIYDDTFKHNKMYAVLYEGRVEGGVESFTNIQTLDKVNLTEWDMVGDKIRQGKASPHKFQDIPVNELWNNGSQLGDFETVVSLIDAYNVLASDRINDKEDLVNAFLMIKGMELPKKSASLMRLNRILSNVPADGDAKYITKQLNEGELTILRSDILEDIHKISMTPNLSDENFVGNASGVAIKYKLIAFEQNVKTKERHLERALIERMKLYAGYLKKAKKTGVEINSGDVDVIFKRNLPQNDFETSQTINNLSGLVDEATLISQLSFVKDAEETLEKLKEQKMEKYPTGEFGTIDETVDRIGFEADKEVETKQKTILERLSSLVK